MQRNLKEQVLVDNPVAIEKLQIMLVTGEASGDSHGAELVKEIYKKFPHAHVFGMGGSALKSAGMELTIDSEKSASVMGLTELLGSLKKIISAFKALVKKAETIKPHLAILIDFPDFNLRLAKKLKALDIPILYYVPPQIWAWRSGRVKTINKYITKVASIFPFEEEFYKRNNVDVEFVGHPFLDREESTLTREVFLRNNNIPNDRPIIGILPGSRKSEVERLLVTQLEGFKKFQAASPAYQAIIPVASTLNLDSLKKIASSYPDVYLVKGQAREVLEYAELSLVASGTATVEAALSEKPFIVLYKLSNFSYLVAKLLITGVKNFAMVNLIAGKQIVPELLQEDVNKDRISLEMNLILGDKGRYQIIHEALKKIHSKLQGKKENKTTSERVVDLISEIYRRT
ncbi:MAG: lipid-A-disaccharide synthase [Proteobacteria bacterium]|nr:lipid-A-disaccharide synthase [Pseudomonadota bacterium]